MELVQDTCLGETTYLELVQDTFGGDNILVISAGYISGETTYLELVQDTF